MMRKKLTRLIAGFLFAVMIMGGIPISGVNAAEVDLQNEQGEQSGELQNDTDIADNQNQIEQTDENIQNTGDEEKTEQSWDEGTDLTTGVSGDTEDTVPDSVKNTQNSTEKVEDTGKNDTETVDGSDPAVSDSISLSDVDFVYIESPYLSTPGTQRIVFSFSEEISGVENLALAVEDEAGNQEMWPLARHQNNLYLFEKTYSGESYTGIYRGVSLYLYTTADEQILYLSDMGIEVEFGVNEAYDGYEELQPIDSEEASENTGGLEASVVTIDENGVTEAQDSIADALNAVSAENLSISTLARAQTSRSGHVIVALDPGHDNLDAGATGFGLREEELTLKIANYCKEELEKYAGVEVYMTRTGATCPFNKNGAACIEDRVNAAADYGADIFVSFHLNSSVAASAKGAEIIIQNKSWRPEIAEEGAELAESIMDELTALGLSERSIYYRSSENGTTYADGSISDYFSVQRNCKLRNIPGIIIEHAFISNSSDVNSFLKTEAGLKSLGVADATGIAKYLNLSKGAWVKVDGKWYWKENGTYKKNSWLMYGGDWYWLTSDGSMATGLTTIAGTKYYFNGSGVMQTGFITINNHTYYFNSSGGMLSGWISDSGQWYHADTEGVIQSGWQVIDNKKYYFETNGKLKVGWVQDDETKGWYYIAGKHEHSSGWTYIGSNWYYFDLKSGEMQTGWLTIGNYKYYLNGSGQMLTGLQTIGGKKYYFDAGGPMKENIWMTISGARYYFGSDGKAVTGWQTISGKEYLFGDDGKLATSGWLLSSGVYYYLKSDGSKSTGWVYIGSDWYYFDLKSGEMQTGWLTIGNYKYYLNGSGQMLTGLQTIEGEKYYFDAGGPMKKNIWMTISGARYYFGADGKAVTGWQTISGKEYLFGDDGKLATSGWLLSSGVYYYLKSDGSKSTGWTYIGLSWYYFKPTSGEMQTGWLTIGNYKYYLNGNGQMLTGLQTIEGEKYYFDAGGPMKKNIWMTISGARYYFGADGKAVTGWQTISGKEYLFGDDGKLATSGWVLSSGVYYYIKSDGSKSTGWTYIGLSWYYFEPASGEMQTGWLTIGNYKYYLNGSGQMLTGWNKIDGSWYYMHTSGGNILYGWQYIGSHYYYLGSDGVMVTGLQYIDGRPYYFEASGEWSGYTSITGTSSSNIVDKMMTYFNQSGFAYPEYYTSTDAPTLKAFCQIYYEEATAQGIKAEVAFCQSMKETGWLQFHGDVNISQNNFAGIGATGNGVAGASFPSVRIGIRAQIQHLFAYATTEGELVYECVDPRFNYVQRGCAPFVEWLGQKENPNGSGWALGVNYGFDIVKMIDDLNKL